ncbi:MAG: metal-dependent phosphohydrolase [Symploca sp. SIO2E6]|nr:metal-dependent phosphohydrolase [Symploca sp. SIO2E6]
MFNPKELTINSCVEYLQLGYCQIGCNLKPNYADILSWTAKMALEHIAHSDALYHNIEHTILVTLAGQEILRGKYLLEDGVSCQDWLHFIISLLCHDIGFVKGVCQQDRVQERLYATGIEEVLISIPTGSTDASLTLFHVDRGKLFVKEQFSDHWPLDIGAIERNIELTRFPVPADEEHSDTVNYPGLARAADLIGQLSDPYYLQKIPALFYEFEEIGANKDSGVRTPGDLRKNYPNFYKNVALPYIQPALRYLDLTVEGKQLIANLYANVSEVEREN